MDPTRSIVGWFVYGSPGSSRIGASDTRATARGRRDRRRGQFREEPGERRADGRRDLAHAAGRREQDSGAQGDDGDDKQESEREGEAARAFDPAVGGRGDPGPARGAGP